MNRATSSGFHRSVVFAPGALLLLCAFIAAAMTREWVIHGLFLNYWHAFAAGVLAYMGGFRRSNPALVLCLALAGIMLVSAPATPEVFSTPAALAAMLLALLGGPTSSRASPAARSRLSERYLIRFTSCTFRRLLFSKAFAEEFWSVRRSERLNPLLHRGRLPGDCDNVLVGN